MALRSLGWTCLGLLLLFGGLLLMADQLIDAKMIREQITKQVHTTTGRTINIGGDIDIKIGLSPSAVLNNISLSNTDSDKNGDMVKIGKLELTIKLIPLIFGDLIIDSLSVADMELRLNTDKNGINNWDLSPSNKTNKTTDKNNEATPSKNNDNTLHFSANLLEISNSNITYHDERNKRDYNAEISELTIKSRGNGYDINFNGQIQKLPLEITGYVGNIIALLQKQGQTPVSIQIKMDDNDLSANGRIIFFNNQFNQASGDISLNIQKLPDVFNGSQSIPSLNIKTSLMYEKDTLTWTDLLATTDGITIQSYGTSRPQKIDTTIGVVSTGATALAKQFNIALLQNPFTIKGRLQKKDHLILWNNLRGNINTNTNFVTNGNLDLPDKDSKKIIMQADINVPTLVLNDFFSNQSQQTATPEDTETKPAPKKTQIPAPTNQNTQLYNPIIEQLGGVITASIGTMRQSIKSQPILNNANIRIKMDREITIRSKTGFVDNGFADMEINAKSTPENTAVSIKSDITHPNMGSLLKNLNVINGISGGKGHIHAQLTANGKTTQDLLNTLSGDTTLALTTASINSPVIMNGALSNPLTQALLANQKNVELKCLATSWPFINGQATTPITALETNIARIGANGNIDVAKDNINLSVTAVTKKISDITIPASVTGKLTRPQISLNPEQKHMLLNTAISLIENKGKLPQSPAIDDDICSKILTSDNNGHYKVNPLAEGIFPKNTGQKPKKSQKKNGAKAVLEKYGIKF